ncbi:hypothetical protein [Streptomyces sp. IB2014 016-6]|uniref:hypothetical protein n=1 Tax=Streptomyces sp. IB2014 016-6 TaxID=2517818 RepID=UPI001F4FD0EA|nr:hypothetical protein [Streptomyces sp. IB2014 016-6]
MPQPQRREITYTDELLADRTVHRRYSDGGQEWRSAVGGGGRRVVQWRDERGGSGTDELLGGRIVKRVYTNGRRPIYGREAGYGRTLWSDGVLTVNRTSFGGRLGTVLGAVTAGAVIGGLTLPPAFLSPEEEEELRRQAEAGSSGGGGDGGGGDAGYGDWGDGSGDSDDDFG